MSDQRFTAKMGIGCFIAVLGLMVTTPIWYWLIYQILMRVNATTTMWVFFWIYMPVGVLVSILRAVMEGLPKGVTDK